MKLKYLTKSIIAGALGICILSSCSDEYLDKKVDVSETQEKIYSDSAKVANVINDFYSSMVSILLRFTLFGRSLSLV